MKFHKIITMIISALIIISCEKVPRVQRESKYLTFIKSDPIEGETHVFPNDPFEFEFSSEIDILSVIDGNAIYIEDMNKNR